MKKTATAKTATTKAESPSRLIDAKWTLKSGKAFLNLACNRASLGLSA